MKIFNENLKKNLKKVGMNIKINDVHKMKYLPAFSKEWKNIIYSFNKNNLKNLPSNNVNINNIIKGYFNLFFKNRFFLGKTKFVNLRKRRNFLKRIYTSNPDIKFTSNKAKITLYTINKEEKVLKRKYYKLYKIYTRSILRKYAFLYNSYIKNINIFLNKKYNVYNQYFFIKSFINKKKYINYKLNYLNTFLKLNNLTLKKLWIKLIKTQSKKYYRRIRKYSLLYSLNQLKFNKSKMLAKLTFLLEKLIGKKLEYNIINLKSITFHPEIFTDILALKIKKIRKSPRWVMSSLINKVKIPKKNTIQERSKAQKSDKIDLFRNKYRNLNIISHLNQSNLNNLLNNVYKIESQEQKEISNSIFNNIEYKRITGIRLEVAGRLTKRYRADRAIKALKWKGGLKNIDSSFRGLSAVYFKGNCPSNVSYSWSKSKRRIGSFAVKGWISGK